MRKRCNGTLKDDGNPQGEAFVNDILMPARKIVVQEQRSGKKTCRNPVFDPPAGTVTERDLMAERLQDKMHFVQSEVYKVDIGPYKESDCQWRKLPNGFWKKGLFVDFKPEYEGRRGWTTSVRESGKEIFDDKILAHAKDAVHARHPEFLSRSVPTGISSCSPHTYRVTYAMAKYVRRLRKNATLA